MGIVTVALALLALGTPGASREQQSWLAMADRLIRQPVHGCANMLTEPVSGLDEDGYGGAAWSLAYAMAALNVLWDTTGDRTYLDGAVRVATSLMDVRDHRLAERYGAERYTDYLRGRVMKAWGTSHYDRGHHTCYVVHQGMLLFPIADLVRYIRSGGRRTAGLRRTADQLERQVREVVSELEPDWRNGPGPGMGHYVSPQGRVFPNNYQSAMGRAYLALGDHESRNRARRLLKYIRSKLTLDKERDCWLWAYSQNGADGPAGVGEDISHAAITGHFLYLCWEHKVGFSQRDVGRLTRTFTHAIHLGEGRMAGKLGVYEPGDPQFTAQAGRWAHLARFDVAVDAAIRAYMARAGAQGSISGPTGALSFAYLARAEKLRGGG